MRRQPKAHRIPAVAPLKMTKRTPQSLTLVSQNRYHTQRDQGLPTSRCAEALRKTWRSAIYSFFSNDVTVQYHDGRLCHFFPCAACKCKTSLGGVRRYQDTKDKSSTTNLKHHAIGCFGEDAVNTALKGKDAGPNSGSIFAAFSRQGQQPMHYSHRMHTNTEVM